MVRYKPSQFTKKELEIMVGVLAVDKGLDFLTGGRLNKLTKKAAVAAYRHVVKPVVTRGVLPAVASVARSGFAASRILMANPYILGGTAIYVGYHERDRIKQLLEQGYEIVKEDVVPAVQPVVEDVLERTAPGREELIDSMMTPRPITGKLFPARAKRKPSSFNKAVAAGIKQVKASTSYGKKGVISSPRKAFSAVTKVISKVKKGKKAPTKGILGKVARAARKRFRRSLPRLPRRRR
jgi:hypothetical protein